MNLTIRFIRYNIDPDIDIPFCNFFCAVKNVLVPCFAIRRVFKDQQEDVSRSL